MWKKLSSKTVFEHPRLTLIEDEVELPSGKKTTYLLRKPDDGDAEEVIAVDWLSEEEVAQLISKREVKNVNMLATWALFRARVK